MQAFKIIDGSWLTIKHLSKPVRFKVFVEEQGVPASIELDENDASCQHFVALDEKNIALATARITMQGKLGRMAVLKPYREVGVGSMLAVSICNHAKKRGLSSVICHAQIGAARFYEKMGFIKEGLPFSEAGILHIQMRKKL